MMFIITCCSLLAVGHAFFLETLGLSTDVHTVTELDVEKYLGRWYQMYTSSSVLATFERGAQCVTADYSLNPKIKNNITVLNSETLNSPQGALKITHGYAIPSDTVGQLTVHLETAPVPAPYWVLKLGPVVNGQYGYSVVSDFFKGTLFVLARDPVEFEAEYEKEVLDFLKQNGFTAIINRPIKTHQGLDCRYNKDHQ